MYLHSDKKLLLAFSAILIGTLTMAGLIIWWLIVINHNLEQISEQQSKVLDTTLLKQNILLQSQSMHQYLLSTDPKYLTKFRKLAKSNIRMEEQLIEIVRDARKPLVSNIKILNKRYNNYCEDRVVPYVQQGLPIPAEAMDKLFILHDDLQLSAAEC